MYTIISGEKFEKQMRKLNKTAANRIKQWINKNLQNTDDPRLHGKTLSGNLSQYWCYRIGDFRLLAHIDDTTVTIFLAEIEHRRSVYKH